MNNPSIAEGFPLITTHSQRFFAQHRNSIVYSTAALSWAVVAILLPLLAMTATYFWKEDATPVELAKIGIPSFFIAAFLGCPLGMLSASTANKLLPLAPHLPNASVYSILLNK